GVDVGPGPADRLHVHLPELAVAPGLRRLMAEHRPEAPELVALAAQQTVGDERAHDAGRGLGTEREALAAAIGEGVHLLADDVGMLADCALEELRVLDDRHANFLVAVSGEELPRAGLEVLPGPDLLRQHVVHPLDRLDRLPHLNLRAPAAAAPAWRPALHRRCGPQPRRRPWPRAPRPRGTAASRPEPRKPTRPAR